MACLALTACTGMGEAWRHRVSGEPALIGFGCDNFGAKGQPSVDNSEVRLLLVVVQRTSQRSTSFAGELPTDWPGQELPITFMEPLPIEVVRSDVRDLLTSLGYAVETEQSATARRVEVTISRLDSGHEDADWNELKGLTWAQLDVDVTIVRGPDDRWLWEFTRRGELDVLAFLASHVESAYGSAYCQILDDFDAVFQSAEFSELVR